MVLGTCLTGGGLSTYSGTLTGGILYVIGVVLKSIVNREEAAAVKIYYPFLIGFISSVYVFIYYQGFSDYQWMLELLSLGHAHKTSIILRLTSGAVTFFFTLALVTATSSRKEHEDGFNYHTKYWMLKIFYLLSVCCVFLFVVSESFILNVAEVFIHSCACFCKLAIAWMFYRMSKYGPIISHLADNVDSTLDIGPDSSNGNNMNYTSYAFFAFISLILFVLGGSMIAHLFFLVEVRHQCHLSFVVTLFTFASVFFAVVLTLYIIVRNIRRNRSSFMSRREDEVHEETRKESNVTIIQFGFVFFIVCFYLWRAVAIDDPSQCIGESEFGETVHVLNILGTYFVCIMALIISTISVRKYSTGLYDYHYGLFNLFCGLIVCLMASVITNWGEIEFVKEGFSEEMEISIANRAVLMDVLALLLLSTMQFYHLVNVVVYGHNYDSISKKRRAIIEDEEIEFCDSDDDEEKIQS